LWTWTNLLAAALALAGTLIYVFVYTIWLKRATPQNIVIGGAAGAIPPLVGWAAVTGRLDLTALALFAVIFFWTPPHFWALAQLIKADYARANIPMLPVVAGERSAKRQSVVYAVLTAAVSVVPFFTGSAGAVYLAGAIVTRRGARRDQPARPTGRRWTAACSHFARLRALCSASSLSRHSSIECPPPSSLHLSRPRRPGAFGAEACVEGPVAARHALAMRFPSRHPLLGSGRDARICVDLGA
jgi:hypothetical protein